MIDFSALQDFADEFAAVIRERCGYDRVDNPIIHIYETSVDIALYLYDDFQSDLSYDLRVKFGSQSIEFPRSGTTFEPDLTEAYLWPTREQRELRVMARQLASVTGSDDKLTSIAAQEFAAKIRADAAQLHRQIESM